MKETGMVMEVDRQWAVVFTSTGEFKKVRYYGTAPEIGTELTLAELNQRKAAKVKWKNFGVVAAVLLIMMMTPFISGIFSTTSTPTQTVAYVSVDINPSIHMAIDKDNRVLQAKAINSDGESILKQVQIHNKTVEDAVSLITEEAIVEGFITKEKANSVVVAIAPVEKDMKVAVLEQSLVASAKSVLSVKDLASEVQVFQTDQSLKEQAEKNGLSMGKLALALKANNDGIQVSLDDMKNMSITEAFNKHNVKAEKIIAEVRQEPDVANPEAIAALVEAQQNKPVNVMSTKNTETSNQNQAGSSKNGNSNNGNLGNQNQGSVDSSDDVVKPGTHRPNVDPGSVLGPRPTVGEGGGKGNTGSSQPGKSPEDSTPSNNSGDNTGDITSDLPNTNDAKPVIDKVYSRGNR